MSFLLFVIIAIFISAVSKYSAQSTSDLKDAADFSTYSTSPTEFSPLNDTRATTATSMKMSDFVKKFVEHFKNPDSMHMPLPIPDPMSMPDREYPFKVYTTNVTASGVSRLKVENFTADVVEMKIHLDLRMPKLEITGTYFYSWLLQKYSSPFSILIVNAYFNCDAKLQITRLGELEAADIKMELNSREKIHFDMPDAAGVIAHLLTNLGEVIFDNVKPFMFKIMNRNIRGNINEHLRKFKVTFPNSIPPVDLAIAKARKFLRNNNWDPYHASADYKYGQHTTAVAAAEAGLRLPSYYSLDISEMVIAGVSSIYRLGDIKVSMDNDGLALFVEANLATENLEARCSWHAGVAAGIWMRSGTSAFTVDHIRVLVNVSQPLDIRKKPRVVHFVVQVGNIQLRMDGAGILDYVAEFAVNVIPNIIRDQITHAAHMPVKRLIQEFLDNTDAERFLLDALPVIDGQLYKSADISVMEDRFVDEGLVVRGKDLDQELVF